ncbi:MAG: M15 family metallopeptidase [Candidatus Pacebacteria bacterium]|nr:M15 family metallopeptidase [Candidatus Paceibacterota bacterium]
MQNNPSSIPLQPPQILLDDIVSVQVKFFDFNEEEKVGEIEIHKTIQKDIQELFDLIYELKFPLQSVLPVSEFNYEDDASMNANNTSAFNFRTVALDPSRISNHGYGLAVDINPVQNPYIKGDRVLPESAVYDEAEQGTLSIDHPITQFMKKRGYIWGGDWDKSYLDYQHFHKEPDLKFLSEYESEIAEVLENRRKYSSF